MEMSPGEGAPFGITGAPPNLSPEEAGAKLDKMAK
jgi:hypothetical protein